MQVLARILSVSLEEMRDAGPRLQQHLERISQLPKPRQRMVLEMLGTVLAKPEFLICLFPGLVAHHPSVFRR